MHRVVLSVDGTLADFHQAALDSLRMMYPAKKVDGDWPKGESDFSPYTNEEWNQFCKTVPQMPSWWLRVWPIQHNLALWWTLNTFGTAASYEVYYLAMRSGPLVMHQTQTWLRRMGAWQDNCSLFIAQSGEERRQFFKAANPIGLLTAEPRIATEFEYLYRHSPQHKVFLLPFNNHSQAEAMEQIKGLDNWLLENLRPAERPN